MPPSVSVIVPVYNGAEFVAEAIDGALAQTHRNTEVIVVNDGSTDVTPAILAGYGSRITVLSQPNRGLAASRNRAVREASGDLLALLDADDCWEESFLAHAVATLEACGTPAVGAFSGWIAVDRAGNEIQGQRIVRRGTFGLRDLILGNLFHPSTVILRRHAVLTAGGFDVQLRAVEDWDLWLRLAAAGGRFAAVDRCLCRYRIHPQGLSQQPDPMRAGRLGALNKLFANSDLPEEIRAIRPRALASAYMQSAVHFYAVGRDADGDVDFALAVRHWPALLAADETYYAVICATQPLGFKASPHGLDLEAGERRIAAALAHCATQGSIPSDAERRQARGRASSALARLAYGQRRMDATRRHAVRALVAHPALWIDRPTIATLVKSLAGRRLVEALSRLRHGSDAD